MPLSHNTAQKVHGNYDSIVRKKTVTILIVEQTSLLMSDGIVSNAMNACH